MANGLQYHAALQQIHGGCFVFSSLCYHKNTRNDSLGNFICRIVDNGGSWNPVFALFGGTRRELTSLVRKRDSTVDDVVLGITVARYFMTGLVSAVSLTAAAPLDRVKILLQNQQELIKCGRLSKPYRGITDCIIRIIKNEGVFSLWRGNSVNLIRIFSEQVLKVLYGYAVAVADPTKGRVGHEMSFLTIFGVDALLYSCLYPLKYAHTRLASDIKCIKNGGERQFNGIFDVYKKTVKSDSFVGIYRGFYIGILDVVVDSGSRLPNPGSPPMSVSSKILSLIAHLLIGEFCILVAYPFETVQMRMMMTCGEASKYKNSANALVQIIRNEGILSLYRGYGASILRSVPILLVMIGYKKLQNRPFGSVSVVVETKLK